MATKSILRKQDLPGFESFFQQSFQDLVEQRHSWHWLMQRLSLYLEHNLVDRLQKTPGRDQVQIVCLGSWSRTELCPRSDIDVIILGHELDIVQFVQAADLEGISLKYRTPENRKDWTIGVDSFDLLALSKAVALDSTIKSELSEQQELLKTKISENKLASTWVEVMYKERQRRNLRYDSLANYLEPNLKYGPGALRDAEQTSVALGLYPELFSSYRLDISHFENCKAFLLVVRFLLHLKGAGDILDAQTTLSVSKQLGFKAPQDFNAQVQKNLYEINFITQWVRELIQAGSHQDIEDSLSVSQYVEQLLLNPSIVMQGQVRKVIKNISVSINDKHNFARQFVEVKHEQNMFALYQSELLFKYFPHLKRCHGAVQYDHYHRYTVDAHTVQALRVYCQCLSEPETILGKNAQWLLQLNTDEKQILLWSLLYHDMAKGLKGSHSELGAHLAETELKDYALENHIIEEVAWQVRHHLILSEASFRKNPEDPSTWQWVNAHGSDPMRLRVLACLTAIDIIATNKDAWTPWKSNLLFRLVQQLLSPQATHFVHLVENIKPYSTQEKRNEFIEELSPMLLGQVNVDIFQADFMALTAPQAGSLPVIFIEGEDGHTWVRYHSSKDSKGLFLQWCKVLKAIGCPIREAYIHTYSSFGAYDWFKIKTDKKADVLLKQVSFVDLAQVKIRPVVFSSVKVIDKPHPGEWIVKFKGTDQDGALLYAVSTIGQYNLEIVWARVHTWGEVLEDVFALRGSEADVKALLEAVELKPINPL